MEGLFLLAALLALAIPVGSVLGIAAWVRGQRALDRLAALEAEIARLRGELAARATWPGADTERTGAAEARPGAAPPLRAAGGSVPPSPAPEPAASEPAAPPPAAEPALGAAAGAEPAPAPVLPSAATPAGRDLEATLTLRWAVWAGAAALLLAGVFLIRYAVENDWLGPAVRCVLAALLGAALVGAGEWLRRRPAPSLPALPLIGPDQAPGALVAGGVSVLFGAAYAAGPLYGLVPPWLAFALMAAAGLAGMLLSLLHGALVAAIGIAGAFVTPALVATQEPNLPGLFFYLLVVTAAAVAVVRHTAWAWLGWAAIAAGALWATLGGLEARGPDRWAPALFVPAAAAVHLGLLPREALAVPLGRCLAWAAFGMLALAGLAGAACDRGFAGIAGMLLLSLVALGKARAAPALDRLPWLAAGAGLLALLLWPLPHWAPTGEAVTVEGVVQGVIPGAFAPEALRPFLAVTALFAALHLVAGLVGERRAAPARTPVWAALAAAVPVLALALAYARVRGFAADPGWALAGLPLAALLIATTAASLRAGAPGRAGVHAAGAVAALALGVAMVLRTQWLTVAIALFLPPLAWIEGRTGPPALRRVALAVAAVVLVRLLLNEHVLDYAYGTLPVLNGLWLAYGVPAACFALAAALFRRRGDDRAVVTLEGGAAAFATALVVLQIRHYATGGALEGPESGFLEQALLAPAFGLLALATLALDRRLGGRPVLALAWRLQGLAALAIGAGLLVANPAFVPVEGPSPGRWPVLNLLLPAYLLPAALALFAARLRETAPKTGAPLLRGVLAGYALLAAFAWVTLSVRHAFHAEAMRLDAAPAEEAELWAYSGAWLLFGAALLWLGIRSGARAVRLTALGVIALATLKVFLVDMNELVGLWRVLSFLGLGLALIGLGLVYRRWVLPAPGGVGGRGGGATGAASPSSPAPAPPG